MGTYDSTVLLSDVNTTGSLLPHERVWYLSKKHIDFARRCTPKDITDADAIIEGRYRWERYCFEHKVNPVEERFAFDWALAEKVKSEAANPYDYYEWARLHHIFMSFTTTAAPELPRGVASQLCALTVQQYYHALMQNEAGNKVYEILPGLAAQLMDTELRGLITQDVRLPFESVCLIVPPETNLKVWNNETGWHDLDAIYIIETRERDGMRRWRFLLSGKSKNPNNLLDDALIWFALELEDGLKIEEVVDRAHGHLIEHEAREPGAVGEMVNAWIPIFLWALNAIIYATWPDAERSHVTMNKEARQLWDRILKLPAGKKRDRLKQEFNNLDPRRRIQLGKSIIYVSRDKAQEDQDHGSETGKPLTIRIRVQGHWKKQFHGPKRGLRKLIWIQPYWKGPEDGALSQAVHRMTGSQERSSPPVEKEHDHEENS